MYYYFIFFLFIIISCGSIKEHKIEIPNVSNEFYQSALDEVKKKYSEKPTDRLLRQKLYYYEKLKWPKESIYDLNIFLEKNGLDQNLVKLFLQYYLNNEEYAELSQLLDKWEFYNGLDEELSQYRVLSHYKSQGSDGTSGLLMNYIKKFNSLDSYKFAIDQAIILNDTSLLSIFFPELSKLSPRDRRLITTYCPILFKKGKLEESYDILTRYRRSGNDYLSDLLLAKILYQFDSMNTAKKILSKYNFVESNMILSDWYKKEKVYDSAVFYLDQALLIDSARHLLLAKGDLLGERGWYNSSYRMFNYLIQKDSMDSIAVSKASIVARKIAYLRDLKESKEDIPIPEILPKRIIE